MSDNPTDDPKAIKRSISFPPPLFGPATAKAKAEYGGNLSLYVQTVLARDLGLEKELGLGPPGGTSTAVPAVMTVLMEIRDLLKSGASMPGYVAEGDRSPYPSTSSPSAEVIAEVQRKAALAAKAGADSSHREKPAKPSAKSTRGA